MYGFRSRSAPCWEKPRTKSSLIRITSGGLPPAISVRILVSYSWVTAGWTVTFVPDSFSKAWIACSSGLPLTCSQLRKVRLLPPPPPALPLPPQPASTPAAVSPVSPARNLRRLRLESCVCTGISHPRRDEYVYNEYVYTLASAWSTVWGETLE